MPSIKRAAIEEGTESTRKAARTDAGRPKSSETRLPTPEPTSEAQETAPETIDEPALDAEEPIETVEAVEEALVVKKEKKQKKETVKKARLILTSPPTVTYKVLAFGANESCQLGIAGPQMGLDAHAISKQEDLEPLISPTYNLALSGHGVVQLALGSNHGVALTNATKVLTWGCGDFGQLGRELPEAQDAKEECSDAKHERAIPAEVTNTFPVDTVITQVAASASASFALTATGDVWGWGTFTNIEGVMGLLPPKEPKTPSKGSKPIKAVLPDPPKAPVHLSSLKNITKLATSPNSNHLLALDNAHNVYSLGTGEANQLGRRLVERYKMNGLGAEKVIFPKDDRKTLRIVEIAVGDDNSFGLDHHGRIWSWGRDDFGQLGHNDPDAIRTSVTDPEGKGKAREEDNPTPAKSPGSKSDLESALPRLCLATAGIQDIASIAAGRDFAVARTQSGELFTWGRIDGMALGHDTTQLAMADLRFVGDWDRPIDPEMSIEDTYNHLPYTLLRAKQVANIGILPALPAPTAVPVHSPQTLAVGPGHIMVVNDTGAVFCWGSGEGWRLGLGRSLTGPKRIDTVGTCSDQMKPQYVHLGGCLGAVVGSRFGMLLAAPGGPSPAKQNWREPTPVFIPGKGDYEKIRMSPTTQRQVSRKGIKFSPEGSVQSTFF